MYSGGTTVGHKMPVNTTIARMVGMARGHARMSSPALYSATAIPPCRREHKREFKCGFRLCGFFFVQLRRSSSRSDGIATSSVFFTQMGRDTCCGGGTSNFLRLLAYRDNYLTQSHDNKK